MIRTAVASDQGYVASTWHRSVRELATTVDRVLDRPRARVVVLCPDGWADRIEGWLCYERQPRALLIHMAYVRKDLRRKGRLHMMLQSILAGLHIPIVVTAKEVPIWANKKMIRMTLTELMPPIRG